MTACKTFKFQADTREGTDGRSLTVHIPEVLDPQYGMYVWPCAAVLAQFIWFHREQVTNKNVLEIGAGTSLPGIVAAKLGASVTLSDDIRQPQCLNNCRKSCDANQLENVKIFGISWGLFTPSMVNLPAQDILLASDCFYDSKDFEDVISTIKFFIEKNNNCECWVTYQQRRIYQAVGTYTLTEFNLLYCSPTISSQFTMDKKHERRQFGEFKCFKCSRRWSSANSWSGMWQECQKCKSKVYPHDLTPLKGSDSDDEGKAPHRQDLCGMCKKLGRNCEGY